MERISIRDAIFREVASNILIHREYRNAFPAKLIIEYGQVRTENSNKPRSSKQKYRLTEKGRRVLAGNQEDAE